MQTGLCGLARLVVPDGHRARRRPDAVAGADAALLSRAARASASAGRCATALAGVGVHTLAMLATTAAIAALVYEWLGLAILRSAWLNIDLVWVAALIATGALLLIV